MEANRLNQLLRENPNYLEEFSNDIFNHFTENSWLLGHEKITGFNNVQDHFLEGVFFHDKDPSILQGALIGVYSDLNDAYKRRGGESQGLFSQAENINTKDFFDSLKNRIKEQVVYYSDPKHANNMFTSYYIDNIQPQNQTTFSKTLNNIDQSEKTMELAKKTQGEREASKREEREDITIEKPSKGLALDEYIDVFKTIGKSANPKNHVPEISSDEYKNFKKMPDSEFRDYIDKLASGSPQDDRKAKNILQGIGFYEANPRKVERFSQNQMKMLETAKKAGYVQGVCECVVAVGEDRNLGKKLMSEMNVTLNMVQKYANPLTAKTLEEMYPQKQEQKLEHTQGIKL